MDFNIELLWPEYSNLVDLLKTYEVYEMVYEDLHEVHSVVDYFSTVNFISEETIKLAQKFQDKWYKIISSKNYSSDRVFIYLDEDFQLLLDNELTIFLAALNEDLEKINFKNIESLKFEKRKFPTRKVLLKRVDDLYSLLNSPSNPKK